MDVAIGFPGAVSDALWFPMRSGFRCPVSHTAQLLTDVQFPIRVLAPILQFIGYEFLEGLH